MTQIYLVRHGETEWNVEPRRKQGHLDSALTERGVEQAHAAAEKLRDVEFDAVYSSDLGRAMATAEILVAGRNLDVEPTERLRERTLHCFDGMWAKDYKKATAELWQRYAELPDAEKWTFKLYEDYETDEQILDRLILFLKTLPKRHAGGAVLVVTHGGVIRPLLAHFGFASLGELKGGTFGNAGIVRVAIDEGSFRLVDVDGFSPRIQS